jgi:hypothetical protein
MLPLQFNSATSRIQAFQDKGAQILPLFQDREEGAAGATLTSWQVPVPPGEKWQYIVCTYNAEFVECLE